VLACLITSVLAAGSTLQVRVLGAPGSRLRIIGNGGKVISGPVAVTGATFTHSFKVPKGTTWAYAELYGDDQQDTRQQTCEPVVGSGTTYCRNRIALPAMTSAIYVK